MLKYGWNSHPSEINNGDCYRWAFLAYLTLPNVQLVSCGCYGGHAFIYFKDRYYDAQHLNGVVDWRGLNFFTSTKNDEFETDIIEFQDEEAFIRYWCLKGTFSDVIDVRKLTKKI